MCLTKTAVVFTLRKTDVSSPQEHQHQLFHTDDHTHISPEHQVHQLKALSPQEAVSITGQHEAGAEGVEEVLHHLLLLGRGRVVTFEHLREGSEREQ